MKSLEHRRVSIAPILVFQRRTERLDWRRIASLDIEKLIQDGDPDQLEEYITPILFCKAEAEFDQDRTDPGFIKVFRLSQLIGEYLLFSYQKDKDTLGSFVSKCHDLEEEKGKFVQEIVSLKDSLVGAKKELKKRKDLLALTQTEVLGSNNQDEFDQCPYCPKRFLTPIYLHAHLQRRHQGLPMPFHPPATQGKFQVFHQLQQSSNPKIGPTPTVYTFTMSPNGTVTDGDANLLNKNNSPSDHNLNLQDRRESSTQTLINIESEGEVRTEERTRNIPIRNSVTTFPSTSPESKIPSQELLTETKRLGILAGPHRSTHTNERTRSDEEIGPENASHVSKIDLNAICDLVEKYLEQKSVATQNQHYDKILTSIQQSRDQRDQFVSNNLIRNPMSPPSPMPTTSTSLIPTATGSRENIVSLMALGTTSQDNVRWVQDDATPNGVPATGKTSTEMVEANVMRMKDEFEAQWRHLSEKVRDSGIEQLKGSFLTEIKKVQEIILKSPGVVTESGVRSSMPGVTPRNRVVLEEEGEVKNNEELCDLDDKVMDNVEERLRRQEEMMAELRSTLKSKMQDEVEILKRQLESQETFWRSKLQATELEHQSQFEKLAKNPQAKSISFPPTEGIHVNLQQPQLPSPATKNPFERTSIEGIRTEDVINSDSSEHPLVRYHPHPPSQNSAIQNLLKSHPSNPTVNENSNTSSKIVPIAKPRKNTSHLMNSEPMPGDSFTSSCDGESRPNHNGNSGNTITHVTKYTDGSGFGEASKGSNSIDLRVTSEGESRIINQVLPHEVGVLIPSDSEEPEYLTIIHPEEPVPLINTLETHATKTGRALSGSQPQVHEYEEPLNVQNNSDKVSDYTFSHSEDDSEEYSVQNYNSKGDFCGSKGSHAEGSPMKRSTLGLTRQRRNYIFDPKKGKIIEAFSNETQKTQMDLMREKTVKEIDKQMEELGINPEASTIGIDEMTRALKYLKAGRKSLEEDPAKSQAERNSLKQEVNYEATKRSIHQKLEKYGAINPPHTGQNKLAKMISKVASAMKRKRKSPSISKKVISEELDLKTSFFSKSRWGRKGSKKPDNLNKKSTTSNDQKPPESLENSSSDEETDRSSVDIEMHPFMTKSGPILMKSEKHKHRTRKEQATRIQEELSEDDYETEDVDSDQDEGDGKLRRASPCQRNVHQQKVIKELKAKLGKPFPESPPKLKPNSPKTSEKPEYKGPNFFVTGSPSPKMPKKAGTASPLKNKNQVQVTSNGWSSRPITALNNPNPTHNPSSSSRNVTNPSTDSKNGKKPFRRDLLEEFEQAEPQASQNNKLRATGGGRKTRNSDMPIVPEQEEAQSSCSSETCCSSYEGPRRANKYDGGHHDEDEDDEDDDFDGGENGGEIKGRDRSQSFCRSDENRQGFRNRRSSYSHSDSDDGRAEQENRALPTSHRRTVEDKGHYGSQRHGNLNNPKSPPKHVTSTPLKPSVSNDQGRWKSNKGRRSTSPESHCQSDPTLHSSDTSVWESEDEEDSRAQGADSGNKLQTKKSPWTSAPEIENNNSPRTAGFSQQQENYDFLPSSSVINKRSKCGSSTVIGSGKTTGHLEVQGGSKSNYSSKLGPTRAGRARRSPLNNSWDSD